MHCKRVQYQMKVLYRLSKLCIYLWICVYLVEKCHDSERNKEKGYMGGLKLKQEGKIT